MGNPTILNIAGIDLGTTNTVISAFIGSSFLPITFEGGQYLCPSVVSLGKDLKVGDAAKVNMIRDCYCVRNVKRLIGRKMSDPGISDICKTCNATVIRGEDDSPLFEGRDGMKYTCAEVSSKIIRFVVDRASLISGNPITHVVLTFPAHFNEIQKRETIEAAELAGVTVLGIVNEPTAAAIGYSCTMNMKDGYYMVYDMGGGTFDVSIVQYQSGQFKVVATGGNMQLGGEDFDYSIATYLREKYQEKYSSDPLTANTDTARMRRRSNLLALAEGCKKNLVGVTSIDAEFSSVVGLLVDGTREIPFTRVVAQSLLDAKIKESMKIVDDTLVKAGITVDDIEKVLLVGGSSRLFCLNDVLKQKFNRDDMISEQLSLDTCVATGAAMYGRKLIEKANCPYHFKVFDCTSSGYGLCMMDGSYDCLIPAGSILPMKAERRYRIANNDDDYFATTIFEGDGPSLKDCVEIQPIDFPINPAERNGRAMCVMFDVSETGVLSIQCHYTNSSQVLFSVTVGC